MKTGFIVGILVVVLVLSGQNTKTTGPNRPFTGKVLAAEQYSLSIFAFHDFNGNGKHDPKEPPTKGIRVTAGSLSGVTGPDGRCNLGYVRAGRHGVTAQDPSGKFRHILPSVSEVKPIGDELEIAVDRDMEVLLPLGEGFLTLPYAKGARLTRQYSYFDLDQRQGWVRDWRRSRSTQGRNNGVTMNGHVGVDYGFNEGERILAAAPGIVSLIQTGWPDNPEIQGQGNTLFIYHNDEFTTRYCHLLQVIVEEGQRVDRGDVIALSGNTGTESGAPHLHFQLNRYGREPIDPYTYLIITYEPTYPEVPYQIPLDESPKERALYLYEVLKEHNYAQLEIHLRRYVPELRKIDKEDIEPLDDIVTLALTATNPEVREAFDLMIKGGRRGWGSFNTELQILFWLAEQNEFKENDTLAQAIAMVNGLWVSMGTDEVREAVRTDVDGLLNFFRETNEMQKARGYYCLEDYPLEAKVALTWTGGQSVNVAKHYAPSLYLKKKYPLEAYKWCVTSVGTLQAMREIMNDRKILSQDANRTVDNLINYFWYDGPHWVYTLHGGPEGEVTVDGVRMSNFEYGSTNYIFWEQYMKKGVVFGVSFDFLPFIDSWLKSVGIASNDIWMVVAERPRYHHFNDFNIYYNPLKDAWTANERQISVWSFGNSPAEFILFRPPVHQPGYLSHIAKHRQSDLQWRKKEGLPNDINFIDVVYLDVGWAYYPILDTSFKKGISYHKAKDKVLDGVPSSQMREWLLYSGKNPDSWW